MGVDLYEKFCERKAIMFKKSMYTKDQAKEYFKNHKWKYYKIRTYKKDYWHFRLDDPNGFAIWEEYKVKYLGSGGHVIEIYATNTMNF